MKRLFLLAYFLVCLVRVSLASDALELRPNDHISLVGNGLGERLQHQNEFETLLHQHFADLNLTVRNLCVPGDEPATRLRSLNFGSPDVHLEHSGTDVVVYFFGFNESFRLRKGLDHSKVLAQFRDELSDIVIHTLAQNYNGERPPRVVLVSPIAFEDTGDPNLPTAADRNPSLLRITEAIKTVAAECGVPFADVFTPTLALFKSDDRRLTMDGGQLNDVGHAMFAPILFEAIFQSRPNTNRINASLRDAIADKNFHWFNRFRAVNGYSIYGKRGEAGSDGTYRNREVMNRELAILDEMTANRDQRIWKLASGEPVPETVDDSNTLPFIVPKTNVGGPDDPNAKRGKLGSLDYLTAEEQMETFELPNGYQIQLVASEEVFPELANPVALNFDADGRLWVSTMPSYPHWQPKSPMDDKLLILEDHDGDGTADVCKTFAGGLHQPTGFELGNGGVYVANQQDILFLRDADGDDVADQRERTLIGFDTADSHHGLAAFDWGPGGRLYFQEGTFKYSQIESAYGLTRLIEGGVWQFNPRTRRFGVRVNLAFANPWGYCFNHWGQDFIGDASPGNSYFAAPISGALDFPLKHPGGSQHNRVAREQGYDDGGVRYPTFYPKRIRPLAGCAFLSSEHFPDDAQGDFLVTNVIGDRAVLSHDVTESDSGYVGKEVPMIVGGGDGNFRPVDVDIAPDGSLYVIDWHNALIGHLQHNLRDPSRDHSHGRIWRITVPQRPLAKTPNLAKLSTTKLVDYLTTDSALANQRHAYRARRQLMSRPTAEVIAGVESMRRSISVDDANASHHRLEALWLHQSHNVVNSELLEEVLADSEPRARAAAMRVFVSWMDRLDDPIGIMNRMIADDHPRVRLETLLATTHAAGQDWALDQTDALIRIALRTLESPVDHYTQYALDEAMRRFKQILDQRAPFLPSARRVASAEPAGSLAGDDVTLVAKINEVQSKSGRKSENRDHASELKNSTYGFTHPTESAGRMPLFLDLPPNMVAYQLARLSTKDLLSQDRNADDEMMVPLHREILARGDVPARQRDASLDALVQLENAGRATIILDVIEQLRSKQGKVSAQDRQAAAGLARMLVRLPKVDLEAQTKRLITGAAAGGPAASAALAALIASGDAETAFALATKSNRSSDPQLSSMRNLPKPSTESRIDWLRAVAMVPNASVRISQRDRVLSLIQDQSSGDLVAAGIETLGVIPDQWTETFRIAASKLRDRDLRASAVKTLLRVPRLQYDGDAAESLAKFLVNMAERTPAAQRTSDSFADTIQVADRAIGTLPSGLAKSLRARLRNVAVRLIRISTVEEEMRYDTPYFAVEAGRPVQVVLENVDSMPHNLVIVQPGTLKDVAAMGLQAGPQGSNGNAYVPDSDAVLHATTMVGSDGEDVLTFDAPTEPGEYPYVCTFPQHWYRMYGVMVVVPDLDAYNADPQPPADPIGNNRSFVAAWTSDDFDSDLSGDLRGRSPEIGAKIFQEATCASCHQVGGNGGRIGPALDSVVTKWKGQTNELLREILHPSDRIDDAYKMHQVLTVDGQILSGLLVKETDDEIHLLVNSEATEPTVILQDDIEDMMQTRTSIMPKALMDQFTKDEILELVAYLVSIGGNPLPPQ
ncbi:MAG: PVC-type heme-binding CxxCH protein [Planctomycetota bacterium]